MPAEPLPYQLMNNDHQEMGTKNDDLTTLVSTKTKKLVSNKLYKRSLNRGNLRSAHP